MDSTMEMVDLGTCFQQVVFREDVSAGLSNSAKAVNFT